MATIKNILKGLRPNSRVTTSAKASSGLAPTLESKLLAFRTISAMLQYIPEEEPFQVEIKHLEGLEGHQLNVLKAFATVGVTQSEVIALVVKIDPNEPRVLEVIASIESDDNKSLRLPPPQVPKSRWIGRWISYYSINSGSTRKSNQSTLGAGNIKSIDVGPPDDLNLATPQLIIDYINSYQAAFATPSLATHFYIVKEVLTMEDSNGDRIATFESVNLLRKHVVVTCYQKIRHRLTHTTLALPLLEALRQVPRPIVFNKAVVQDPSEAEHIHDQEFLSILVDGLPSLRASNRDEPGEPIPNLLMEAQKSEDREPIQLYSEATCDEFHAVFLLYLNCFQESLEDLNDCIRAALQAPTVTLADKVKTIESASTLVLIYATTLQTLIRGSALRNHLENIEPSLREYHGRQVGIVGFKPELKLPKMAAHGKEQDEEQAAKALPEDKGKAREQDAEKEEEAVKGQTEDKGKAREHDAKQDDEQDNDEQDDDPRDDDLLGVQPTATQGPKGVPVPVWKAYKKWLMLLVVHFDSIDVLAKHFNNNQQTISLKFLEAPPVEAHAKMLSFETLLRDADLFPIFDPENPDGPDNEKLIQKLSGIPSDKLKVLYDTSKDAYMTLQNGEFERCSKILSRISTKKIPESDVTTWSDHAQALVESYSTTIFPSIDPDVEVNLTQLSSLREFGKGVKSLYDSVAYLNRFDKQMDTFLGSVHCEAILATFLRVPDAKFSQSDPNSSIYKDLQEASRLVGVSKNCCPVCEYLLFILSQDRVSQGQEFEASRYIARGSHKTVTACSLPPWLPEHIVGAMNLHFGHELRKKLVKFDKTIRPARPSSTGSDGFSINETADQIIPLPKRAVTKAKADRWIRHATHDLK